MAATSGAPAPAPRQSAAQVGYAAVAAITWIGLVLTLAVSAFDGNSPAAVELGLYGGRPAGAAGVLGRVFDSMSYFTEWSNVVVAVAFSLLAHRPDRDTTIRRVLLLDALLMITITAIVYAVLLSPAITLTGWARLTNPWQHIVVPVVTLLVWLVFGPRGFIHGCGLVASLTIPVAWIGFMLVRGAIDHTYPYGFTNVGELGYPKVLALLGVLVGFGLAIGALFWLVDVGLRRLQEVAGR